MLFARPAQISECMMTTFRPMPEMKIGFRRWDDVFPTLVGMNRLTKIRRFARTCVPHACGDEPASAAILPGGLPSPPATVSRLNGRWGA
jgi:hypothetical protein